MIQGKHCNLCEYAKRDLATGLTCGLTNKKPSFKDSCPDIKISNSAKENLHGLTNQVEELKKDTTSVYIRFSLFSIIGLTIILSSYTHFIQSFIDTFEPEFNYAGWKYFTLILLLNLVGIQLIAMGFWPLINYRKTLKTLEAKIREIETVLKNYST